MNTVNLKYKVLSLSGKALIDFIQTYFVFFALITVLTVIVIASQPSNFELTMTEAQIPILIAFVSTIVFVQLRFRLIDKTIFEPLRLRFYGLQEFAIAIGWISGVMFLAVGVDYKPMTSSSFHVPFDPWGFLSLCVFGPLFEELFFRKHLQQKVFASLDRRWAVVITSLMFMVAHFLNDLQVDRFVMTFFSGLVLGYVAEKRSWRHSLIVHFFGNTISFFITWWMMNSGLIE